MWRTRVRCEEETVKLAATAAEWAGSRWMKGRRNGFRRTDCWRSAVCGCAGRGLCRGRRRFRRESWGATRAKGPKSGIRTEVARPPSVFFCRGDGGRDSLTLPQSREDLSSFARGRASNCRVFGLKSRPFRDFRSSRRHFFGKGRAEVRLSRFSSPPVSTFESCGLSAAEVPRPGEELDHGRHEIGVGCLCH